MSLSYDDCQRFQSTVPNKMATVHFTIIPCEPNTANKHEESHAVWKIHTCSTKKIVYGMFGVLLTFLCVSVRVFKIFVCY